MALTEVDLARLNDNVFPATGSFSNRLINGDFSIAQRGTSFSGGTTNADDTYTLDRWYQPTVRSFVIFPRPTTTLKM
jgi:hypothetical protein